MYTGAERGFMLIMIYMLGLLFIITMGGMALAVLDICEDIAE